MKQFKFFKEDKTPSDLFPPMDNMVIPHPNREVETLRLVATHHIPQGFYDSERLRQNMIIDQCRRMMMEIYERELISVQTHYDPHTENFRINLQMRIQNPN